MIDQILQQQGGFYGADTASKNDVLGKDAFLKLLVTQLQNQDPLNPLDDKEFIAQLAQFSSLEQMTNISEGITSLTDKTAQQDMLSAVNYNQKHYCRTTRFLCPCDIAHPRNWNRRRD